MVCTCSAVGVTLKSSVRLILDPFVADSCGKTYTVGSNSSALATPILQSFIDIELGSQMHLTHYVLCLARSDVFYGTHMHAYVVANFSLHVIRVFWLSQHPNSTAPS